ncbi:glycosyltransferase family 8 protein [Streptococcus suis]|uniref:glycosyltransferase family 8 protein n=1 Tax=Streptococcus suis TaxID=1307 RepID=UPI0007A60B93|nr:glycosyltransferase family 8 protein [Streptococcus suis]MBO4127287.1 glycosyltransferase family 8 protein [Streptococcus suis]WFA75459.1 glycosyltransferase family 8 protein [Streptococcus suis]
MLHLPLTIVLAADYAYAPYLETTLKSLHVHHDGLKIYLINKDFPSQWFDVINRQLSQKSSLIVDKKIDVVDLSGFQTWGHINEATFYRYYIPRLIPEERVIYLDSDLVVTGSLLSFWELDLKGKGLAAVPDFIVAQLQKRINFNAGVMLIDNQKWREKQIWEQAIALHRNPEVTIGPDADQEVLNNLFYKDWLVLDEGYNFQTAYMWRQGCWPSSPPLLIHYTTSCKPWNPCVGHWSYRWKGFLKGQFGFIEALTNKAGFPKAIVQPWHEYHELSWESIDGKE